MMPYSSLRWLLVVLTLGALARPAIAQDAAPEVDPDFKPQLVRAEFSSREVRPGDPFAMTLRFKNAGTRAAHSDYRVFVHFEAPLQSCDNIVLSGDHVPSEPTSLWEPGQVVVDGPRVLTAPSDKPDQQYFVHVGVFDLGGTGKRLLDTYDAGTIRVTASAPSADTLSPPPLSADEVQNRRRALAARIPSNRAVSLEGPGWRFDLDRDSGDWSLTDRATGVLWGSDPSRPAFGEILLRSGKRSSAWRIDRFDSITSTKAGLRLVCRPLVDGRDSGARVTFSLFPVVSPAGLRMAYDSLATGEWKVARVRLLQDSLTVTEAEAGVLYLPHRLGIELPASHGFLGSQQWLTYDDLSMEMAGAVKDGSALLVNWDQVDTRLVVNTTWPDQPLVPGRRARALSLEIEGPRGSCSLHPLGKGSYVEIAHAYRPLARAKGWLVPWAEKAKRYPNTDRILGATDFKPFLLSRTTASSRFSSDGKEHTNLGYTADEIAQCAEHWRHDLGIDRAFVVMAGWTNGGYDVRHPDVLPANPECGGNAGVQDASRRIRACGYLFGLHDNYQDMYADAPSFGQQWLNKDANGKAKMGGNWAGGQAWQVCAIKQVELASRDKTNLPEIARLFNPSIYFIDTVFAWGLVTCEDPAHPMTRTDDLQWKSRLCLLAKKYMGLFGSEEGREWAVPCADYLEGIFGHQTDSPPGSVIPLFPLVYSDCVQIMTHQGSRIGLGDEKKVADHVLFGQMPVANFGSHLYWKSEMAVSDLKVAPLTPVVKDLGDRKFRITYRWKVDQAIPGDLSVFVHFTHAAATRTEGIAYQGDHQPLVPTSQWKPGTVVDDGPYTVEVPAGVNGPAEIMLGLLHDGDRVSLADLRSEGGRYNVGTVTTLDTGITFQHGPPLQASRIWSRGDGGWGEALCPTDRVIKNTWEVLSPLNRMVSKAPMTSHEFLSPDRLLQRTRFGDLTITVAYDKPANIGDNAVPAYGFIAESPTFLAFCATRYNGIDYPTPALFTVRSLDGLPIARSTKLRIYHGFGDSRIRLTGKTFQVAKEASVTPTGVVSTRG